MDVSDEEWDGTVIAPVVKKQKEEEEVLKTEYEGVYWKKKTGKWYGQYYDKLQRKLRDTSYFPKDQLAACIEAYEALKAPREARFWAQVTAWKEADPKFEGFPRGPYDAAHAEPNTVYWRPNMYDGHRPFLAVRVSCGTKGVVWQAACQERGCWHGAVKSKNGAAVHCLTHGGGCPHRRVWGKCRECNPKATKMMQNCSNCCNRIATKRQRSKGGCGLCPNCEDQKLATEAAEAAARGEAPAAPAPKRARPTKEQEIEMFGRLVLAGYVQSFDKGATPRPGEFLREAYFDHRCALARNFEAGEKQFGYVDFVVNPKHGGMLVFLEVDEGEHKNANYTTLCDTTRMWNVCQSIVLDGSGDKHVFWIRLNPDTRFTIGNEKHSPSNTSRCDAVCALLDTLEGKPHDPPMRIAYACYQMEADFTAKITRDADYHGDVLPAVRRLEHRYDAAGRLRLRPRNGTSESCVMGPLPCAPNRLTRFDHHPGLAPAVLLRPLLRPAL